MVPEGCNEFEADKNHESPLALSSRGLGVGRMDKSDRSDQGGLASGGWNWKGSDGLSENKPLGEQKVNWPELMRKANFANSPNAGPPLTISTVDLPQGRCACGGKPNNPKPVPSEFQGYLNVAEFARLSGKSTATVRRHFRNGYIKGKQRGTGPIYILKSELLLDPPGEAAHE